MNKTNIEWVQNPDGTPGYTWNPITGCLNHNNGLCKGGGFPCYAYKLANGRLKQRYLANKSVANPYITAPFSDPFYPRFWLERLLPLHQPRKADSPKKGIFVCDMGELFGGWIPQSWQEQVFNAIKACPDYRFYLLTKQPQNLPKFTPYPDNCWVGVTVTRDSMMQAAYEALDCTIAKIKFISLEPYLSPLSEANIKLIAGAQYYKWLDWLIIGAQTKPYKPPKIEWVREIVEAADKAGIPVFLKDNLLALVNYQSPEAEFAFNKEGYYRQEMPKDGH